MIFAVSVRAESLLARLNGAEAAMRRALTIVVTRLSIEVQRSVKADKLTGQVLHVRTGTLRRSINREVLQRPDGVFAIIGTNVKYAHVHEYGFQGTENVREHARRNRSGTVSNVRAHARKVNIPERSFLRSTLRDFEPRIQADLKAAALSVMR